MTILNSRVARTARRGPPAESQEWRLDLLCAGALTVLVLIMLLPGVLTQPMVLWDESRIANNAIEMVRRGDWLVTTFGYSPDHWNTKPPLLIWMVAALLRTGMDPMLALRLPAVVAATATVLIIFVACRGLLRDRLAGLLGGLLLICSPLVMGDHVGRTGDYDALLCMFNLAFVLSAGIYIDGERGRGGAWIGIAAACLVLAVLTKGIAAGLAVPGVVAYALLRRQLLAVMADWRLWVSLAVAVAGLAGFFALRERIDPGYLAAVWSNEVAGRMLSTLEAHEERRTYYIRVFVMAFEPAILFSPTLLSVLRHPDPARRRLCLLAGLAALSWLVAVTSARTKLFWYAAPIAPLMALAIGVSVSTWLQNGASSRSRWSRSRWAALRPIAVALPIVVSFAITFWSLNVRVVREGSSYALDGVASYTFDQTWYGPFLDEVRAVDRLDGTIVIDGGVANVGGLERYNPVARFFIEDAARHGERMQLVTSAARLPPDVPVLTCDPTVRRWLGEQSAFVSVHADAHCVFGRVTK
jgi:4-amino-4-deoxy-L-arabinose transferase-like glycosyltransferase